ncbi:MAG: phosphoribosylaminoimidazolesuccinocarboxamide synthase [Sulfuritalea sp.]|nr:phosphoribosylaminoimidazolesuccinocarboxamide synthase [Sulfuritalea sp.]
MPGLSTTSPMFESGLSSLPLVARGKVRDIYAVDSDRLLLVATDRLSAFDVVLPTPIADKGRILTRLSNFWFDKLAHIVPNHLTHVDPQSVVAENERSRVAERAVVVKRMTPLPIEAVVRGYLDGSGWAEYLQEGSVCGIRLPPGLPRASRLAEPIFTPSTKAAAGFHDQYLAFDAVAELIGRDIAEQVRAVALALYRFAAAYAIERGVIIADTKFEFGLDAGGRLHLIDEVLTPDSSRFWAREAYAVGTRPESFDKQFVRDWLNEILFDKRPPAPEVPADIAAKTTRKYYEALQRLTGD